MTDDRSLNHFPQTRWSLVERSGDGDALNDLCALYWRPVYGYLRRRGFGPADAEDLTQSFFASVVADDTLTRVCPEKGRFRSFLLGALKRHVSHHQRHVGRLKRGGQFEHLPLATNDMDFNDAEARYAAEPVDVLTAENIFERRWVVELLERAGRRLRRDYEATGKGREHDLLQAALGTQQPMLDLSIIGKELGLKEASVRVLIHRLRRNFRAAFRDEIALTVSDEDDVEEEFQRLLSIFS